METKGEERIGDGGGDGGVRRERASTIGGNWKRLGISRVWICCCFCDDDDDDELVKNCGGVVVCDELNCRV